MKARTNTDGSWARHAAEIGALRPVDALDPPSGLGPRDINRSFDMERLREEAPDVDRDRLLRIVRIREQIREQTYGSKFRLRRALFQALRDL